LLLGLAQQPGTVLECNGERLQADCVQPFLKDTPDDLTFADRLAPLRVTAPASIIEDLRKHIGTIAGQRNQRG
jgi:hypothetical protein